MAVSFINLTFFKNFFGSIVNALFISKIPLLNTTLFLKKKESLCLICTKHHTWCLGGLYSGGIFHIHEHFITQTPWS